MQSNIKAVLDILNAALAASTEDPKQDPNFGSTYAWLRDQVAAAVSELEKPATPHAANKLTVAELVERLVALGAKVDDLESDICHLTKSVSTVDQTLERISPFGMQEADEKHDDLADKLHKLDQRVTELEDTPESDEVSELGERIESVEGDLQDLKDDLPIDWEDAVTEKFDELVGDMIKGALKDSLDRVRLRIVAPSEV